MIYKPTKSHEEEKKKRRKELEALRKIGVHVDKININGLQRTKSSYIENAIQNVFNAKSFDELINETNIAKENLLELGVFKDVTVNVEINTAKDATKDGYQVSFDNEEISKIVGSVGTEIGQNEGSMKVEVAMPNTFGYGERFSVDGSYNNFKALNFNAKFMKPFYHTAYGKYKPILTCNISRGSTKYNLSKFVTFENGLLLDFSFLINRFNILNNLQYEFVERDVKMLDKNAPFFVREKCGTHLSSIFRYICTMDLRNDNVFPTKGLLVRSTNEISGLGGDTCYLSNNTHSELNFNIFNGLTAQLCGRIGIISSGDDNKIPITNLFFLGGPLSLRGFKMAGACNNVSGCFIGANKFWSVGAHLWGRLPFENYFGDLSKLLRLHCFYNCGNSNMFSFENMRSAYGCGISLRVSDKARVEANYTVPFKFQKTDNTKSGFQFGVGYEFI